MYDTSKSKSPGYSRGRNTLRTVTTTKWELPIPGSKPYWDKICDDLEHRKEHVSDSSNPPSPSSDGITDPNIMLNGYESTLSKLNYIVEPIVKISPPTPMRMTTRSRGFTIEDNRTVTDNETDHENDDPNLLDVFNPLNATGKKDVKLYELSVCMTEFLKNSNVQTKKSCQIHKNSPPLKIFDDNLKRFLPKKTIIHKLPRAKMLSSNVLDFSKLHRNKSCPLRSQSALKDRIEFGVSLTKNKNKILPTLRRSKTEDPGKKKAKSNYDQFLKVPKSPYVNMRSNSKYQMLDKKSKSKILTSNLNEMLSIPKLNEFSVDINSLKFSKNMSSEEAKANSESHQEFQTISNEENPQGNFFHIQEIDGSKSDFARSDEKLQTCSMTENMIPLNVKPSSGHSMNLPRLSEELSMALDEETKNNELGIGEDKMSTIKLGDQPEKDFLKVPKLGAISSYPSFSRITSGDSVEAEENQRLGVQGSTGSVVSQNVEDSTQKIESSKRDLLKVPKLSMMSSYPSFTSLIPESLDSDENVSGVSDVVPKRIGHETSSNISTSSNLKSAHETSIFVDKPTPSNLNDERHNESSDLAVIRNKEVTPSINLSQTEKPKRRQSLKDSVRYAYRALKFLTPNKNLDFQPHSYHPPQKSGSSTASSDNSRDSKYSKFEPAIKLLTYEDVNKDWPHVQSDSSSTYGSVKSRLRQSASQYLGSDYVLASSRVRPVTPSTTIPSLTRSTSGPTLNFQEPVLKRPSDKILRELPKMSIFPRRKYDKCFACLHEAFKEPVKSRRELPLATLTAIAKETIPTFSESESSSINLPDVKELVESQSDYDDNWTEVLRNTKKSSMLDKAEWKSSKGFFRTNIDSYKSKQTLARASEESQSLKSDTRIENSRKNLSSKDSIATNTLTKPLSLSSEHSKPSSLSGHSSESEEPQVQIKQAVPASECFVSPYAPLHWAPSLEPLKSLKFRKPVSMHGRAASITKTEDDSTSDDDGNDYRSTRKETKLNNTSTRKLNDKTQDSTTVDSSSKSVTKFGEKSNLAKQPSIVAGIITSQLLTHLDKKQSKADLLSDDSKSENQITSAPDTSEKIPKEILTESQKVEVSLQDEKRTIFDTDHKEQRLEAQSVGRSFTKSPLQRITEQSIENGSPIDRSGNENLVANKSTEKLLNGNYSKLQENELHIEESEAHPRETCEIYSNERVMKILENCAEENRTPFEMLEALSAVATQNDPFTSKETISNPEIARSAKIAKNLMKLLIDSKKYLNPDTFSPNLEFSSPQIPLCNPRQLRRVLPTKTYNLVARILGMPENPVDKSTDQKPDFKSENQAENPVRLGQNRNRGLAADSSDMIVHPPSSRGKRKPTIDESDFEYPQQSPYALFMNKPRRKAIKWRPLTERDMLGYDPEATLNMRATRVTNKICEDFCKWLRGLGGGHSEDIDEEVLRDMFQIEFTAEACRTMQVLIKEIPMVPIAVALARNTPGAGELALTRRHLIRDAKAESMPKKIFGFGSTLPQACRFVPPKNRVKEKWLQCENVPRDLETMETVWKGITHLDSVKGFLAWVKAHPGVKLPKILAEAYAKKETLMRQPSMEEASGHIELEMDQIESLKVGDVE